MALRDVMQHVVEVEKESRKRTFRGPSRARAIWLGVFCAALAGLSAYSWFARPEFIWGPQRHAETPQKAVANERGAIFLLSRRIEAYRAANGRYPESLAALGTATANAGITYSLVSDSVYRLSARGTGGDVTYQSNQPADQFIGNSLRVLGGTRVQR